MSRRPFLSAVFALTAVLALAAPVPQASAVPIITGDGETWTGGAAIGGDAGTTVVIDAHPLWQPTHPDGSVAEWISYANTGFGGTQLAPRLGSPTNPDGTAVIMTVYERFFAAAGDVLDMKVWADDTARVRVDDLVLAEPNFSQNICANGVIGCEPGEAGVFSHVFTTTGIHTLSFDVFQVGSGGDPSSNPFGVLYVGELTQTPQRQPQRTPEPASLMLLGVGLIVAGAVARVGHRRRRAGR
jgi:hypothetical protein